MSTLAEVRQDFVQLVNRYDLLDSGDLSANVDDGANAFLNAGLRYLDTRVKHKKSFKKFVKVLATGDYFFTVPDYIELKHLKLITSAAEIDLTKKELSIGDFHSTYQRPYADWTSGAPTAWAVNDDILVDEQQFSIPQGVLGQTDTRVKIPVKEMLNNPSFADALTNADHSLFPEPDALFVNDAEWWDRPSAGGVLYNPVTKAMDVNAAYTAGDDVLTQGISEMVIYPDLDKAYAISLTVSNYVSGALVIGLGDSIVDGINGDGVWTKVVPPTTYEVEPNFRVRASTTDTINLTIDSVSVKRVDLASTSEGTMAPDVDPSNRTGIIFNPPTDEARTVEFYARFFTTPMSADTDRNFYTDNYPLLLAQAAAHQFEKRNQSTARMRYWLEAMQTDISELEDVMIEDEMTFMENSYERTR